MTCNTITIKEDVIQKTAKLCKERNIIIPTIAQQKNPNSIPDDVKQKLKNIGLWDINPLNLFRITLSLIHI